MGAYPACLSGRLRGDEQIPRQETSYYDAVRYGPRCVCAPAPLGLSAGEVGMWPVDENGILLTHCTSHSLFGVVWCGRASPWHRNVGPTLPECCLGDPAALNTWLNRKPLVTCGSAWGPQRAISVHDFPLHVLMKAEPSSMSLVIPERLLPQWDSTAAGLGSM